MEFCDKHDVMIKEIEILAKSIASEKERVDRHEKTLNGNGEKGIKEKISVIETQMKLIITLLTLVGSGVIGILLKLFFGV